MMAPIFETITYPAFHRYFTLKERALNETANYISAKMPDAISRLSTKSLMDVALNALPHEGCFEGLSGKWHGNRMNQGDFSLSKHLPKVPANVRLHVGWFNESLPKWLDLNAGHVAFIHIDCDLYTSTKNRL